MNYLSLSVPVPSSVLRRSTEPCRRRDLLLPPDPSGRGVGLPLPVGRIALLRRGLLRGYWVDLPRCLPDVHLLHLVRTDIAVKKCFRLFSRVK